MKSNLKHFFALLFSTIFIGLIHGQSEEGSIKKWTLQDCITYAIDHNIDISLAKLDNSNSEINKLASLGAFLPTLNFNMNHSWNSGLNQDITTGILQNTTTQYTSLGLGSNIIISRGLQNVRNLHKANLQILASRYQIDDMKDNVSLMVISAFVQILFSKESLKTAQYQQDFAEEDVKRANTLVELGALPKGDLLSLQATLSEREQSVQIAKNILRISKLNLAQLLLLDSIEISDKYNSLEVPNSEIFLHSPEEIYQKSLQVRNNIKVAETNLEISKTDLKIAKGGYLPVLSGSINYNTRASYADRIIGRTPNTSNPTSVIGVVDGTNQNVVVPNFNNIAGTHKDILEQFQDNDGISYGINLSMPILSGLNTRNRVRRTEISIERQKLNLENLKRELKSNVYKSWTDLQAASKTYVSSQKTLLAREEAFKYAKKRFQEGAITVFEYSQASDNLEGANSSLTTSRFDFILKIKLLEYYFNLPLANL